MRAHEGLRSIAARLTKDESKLARNTLIMVGGVTSGGLITVEGSILARPPRVRLQQGWRLAMSRDVTAEESAGFDKF